MWKEVMITVAAAVLLTMGVMFLRLALQLLRELLAAKRAEAEAAGNKAAAAAYDMAATVLDSIAEITVSSIEATQAAAVRKAVKSGEKPFTELTRFSEDAYRDIVDQLAPCVMASLETCVGNTEKLIRNKIEEVLPKVKSRYRALEDKGGDTPPWDMEAEEVL